MFKIGRSERNVDKPSKMADAIITPNQLIHTLDVVLRVCTWFKHFGATYIDV